ncbi:MAG TPA: zf-HC2 domain-containing protein [Ktedonobacterales bacterium]|nr:zf-HC2 domain-containing protein [Ktedonobacterales bacterium]
MKDTATHAWLRRVSDYHSGGVSARERTAVEVHLTECAECRLALAAYRRFYTLARSPLRLGDDGVAALAEYRHTIQEETMIPDNPDRKTESTMTQPRRPPNTLTALGAIAAVLVIAILASTLFTLFRSPSHPGARRPHVTPTPTSGQAIIYQDPLTSPSANWPSDVSAGCFFDSDGLHVKDQFMCIVPPETLNPSFLGDVQTGNSDMSVQVKQISGPATQPYGISVHDYRFDIESDGKWTFQQCFHLPCTAVVGLTANPAIHTGLGAANTLELRYVNSHFDFFVNETKVGQADITMAYVAQATLDGIDGIEVVFTNLKITTAS